MQAKERLAKARIAKSRLAKARLAKARQGYLGQVKKRLAKAT